jgi:accessory gene regulator B
MVFDKVVESISQDSVRNGWIPEPKKGLFQYGLYLTLTSLLSFLLAVVFGALFHCLPEVFAFLLFFVPLRMHSGGYHASSFLRCCGYLLAILVFLRLLIVVVPVQWISAATLPSAVLALAIVIRWAPVSHPNAPIRAKDVPRFRRISRAICILGVILLASAAAFDGPTHIFGTLRIAACLGLLFPSFLILPSFAKK